MASFMGATWLLVLTVTTLNVICGSSTKNSETSSSYWTKLKISHQEIGSVPCNNFRVKIYEHLDNKKANVINRKRYFYAPIALLDHKSAASVFNDVTNQPEMRFRVQLWNDKVENDVASYLSAFVGEPVKTHQVQVIPFEKVILTNKLTSSSYFFPAIWTSLNLHKYVWFFATCFQQSDCDKLAANMRNSPRHFETLQIHFSLSSQFPEMRIFAELGQFVTKILRRFEKGYKEVFLTEKDENRLLTELAMTTTFAQSFDVLSSSEPTLQTYNSIKSLIVSPFLMYITKINDSNWTSVFWNVENYRPDKASRILNEIYEKQSKEIQKKIFNAFTNANKMNAEEITQLFSSFGTREAIVDKLNRVYLRGYLVNLYNESKDYVEWDGEQFVPKPLLLSRVNLELLREQHYKLVQKNRSSYSNATVSISINIANETDTDEECSDPLHNILASLSDDLNDITKAVCSSNNETQFAVVESKSKLTEMLLAFEYLKKSVNNYKSALTGEMKTSLENRLFDLIETSADVKEIENLLKNGADINGKDEQGMTPLMRLMAASNNEEKLQDIVRLLIHHGADVNLKDNSGWTALHYLGRYHSNDKLIDIVRLLIDHGADVEAKENGGWTALHLVCRYYEKHNLIEIIQLFIGNGHNVKAKTNEGWTPLHFVCRHYDNENVIEIIRLLIRHGADARERQNDGWSTLHYACRHYHQNNLVDFIRLLIENGADVNAKTDQGWTALHFACQLYSKDNLIDVVRLLINQGADGNAKTSDGWTALHFVCRHYDKENLIEIIRLMIRHGTDVTAKENDDWTAFHFACRHYDRHDLIEIIRLFIEHGVDVGAKEIDGRTALHIVCRNYHRSNLIEIIRLLIRYGADVNAKQTDRWTALHLVCRNYDKENLIEIIQLLIWNGADVNAETDKGYRAQDLLRLQYNKENMNEILKLL